jgi:glycogen debranching enzyme
LLRTAPRPQFDLQARSLRLGIDFAADFADLFEVRGMVREKRGQVHEPEVRGERVTLSYTGLDDRRRSTMLRFDPAPETLTVNKAVFNLQLAPKETRSIFVEIDCSQGDSAGKPVRAYFTSLRDARRELLSKSSRAVSIASSNATFNESARRARADLYMLLTELPEGPYPYAGIPWYSTVFGRDGLITAMMMLWVDPTPARGVLSHLAATQATEIDPAADAEPGKILHEARHGEMADLREVPSAGITAASIPRRSQCSGQRTKSRKRPSTGYVRAIEPIVARTSSWRLLSIGVMPTYHSICGRRSPFSRIGQSSGRSLIKRKFAE